MDFTLTIDIQPNQELKLKEALENFCSDNFIPQPVLKQCNVSGSLPLVSREELISSLDDKRICKMSDLPADIYYLSRKETADYLMDNYVITKRQ